MGRAKHILMCWEFGGGNGHARRLKLLGDHMAARGFKVSYALRRPEVGAAVGISGEASIAAPNWPILPAPADHKDHLTSATYGDYLAQLLFSPYDDLAQRFGQWHAIVEAARPDLIIADYAPSISLLVHRRIPIIAVGNGYVLPPVSLAAFPRLIDGVPVRFEEAEIIGWINDGLAPYNPNAIERLPQVNRADRTYLLTLPCLDPYREQRMGEGWLGPVDRHDIIPRSHSADRLLAYFQEDRQSDSRLIEGLIAAGLPGKAVFSRPLRQTTKRLAQAGINAPQGLADLAQELPACGVLVHQGSAGMAMAGISAGVPQVMIKTDLEKSLVAQAIATRNAGVALSWQRFGASELADAIARAARDPAIQAAAQALALESLPYLKLDAMEEIAKGVRSLLDN